MDQKNAVSKWLERLQQESWNLELLISAFSIFLLSQVGGLLLDIQNTMLADYGRANAMFGFFIFLLVVLRMASVVLLINLVIHVILRGFWIGTIGLRSVQNKLEFEKLNYSEFFTEKLKKKVTGLDKLLIQLDTICSVIFSFTFLIIFMLLSLFMFSIVLSLFTFLANSLLPFENEIVDQIFTILFLIIIFFIVLIGLIYFVDTISLGFFKKYKRLSKLYYPIYYFLGIITLSFIYRSIYYSLINRFSKNRIRLFLIPYIFILPLFPFFGFNYFIFYPDNKTELELSDNYYDDIRIEGDRIIEASISSQIISAKWLPLFIRYNVNFNEDILKQCIDYTPSKEGGFVSGIKITEDGDFHFTSPNTNEEDPEKLLSCLSGFYQVFLNDSLQTSLDYYYYTHPNKKEKGIYTHLNIHNLPEGKNVITIKKKQFDKNDELQIENYATIPFWKE